MYSNAYACISRVGLVSYSYMSEICGSKKSNRRQTGIRKKKLNDDRAEEGNWNTHLPDEMETGNTSYIPRDGLRRTIYGKRLIFFQPTYFYFQTWFIGFSVDFREQLMAMVGYPGR